MFISIKNLSLDTKNQRTTLCNLLDASREGVHFIWISRTNYEIIKNIQLELRFLSEIQVDTLERLNQDIGDDGHQYIKQLTHVLFIDFQENNISKVEKDNMYISGYLNYIDSSNLRETILLTENLDDGEIYREFGNAYKNRLLPNNPKLQLIMKCVSGGGNCTDKTLLEESKNLTPLLCILDSDKIHPNQTHHGDTAKKVLSAKESIQNNKIFNIEILPVRAIENIIPVYILKVIKHETAELGLVFEYGNEEFKKYIKCKDHKGITLDDLAEKHCNNPKKSYFWTLFYDKYKNSQQKLVCANLHQNLITGKKFLPSCKEAMQDVAIRNQLSLDTESEWNHIAKCIFSWSFSYNLFLKQG